MRPARRASRPASTACRIAAAISAGSWARVTAEASITASQPSSIASAASDAVPAPGVEDHRHARPLDDQLEVVRVADAEPGADRGARAA